MQNQGSFNSNYIYCPCVQQGNVYENINTYTSKLGY
jgi:hypothetical protein